MATSLQTIRRAPPLVFDNRTMTPHHRAVCAIVLSFMLVHAVAASGQSATPSQTTQEAGKQPAVQGGVVPPPGYVIGPEDVLSILFWREKDLSSDVMVRPDGMISLPLLNDIQAAGLTTDELREKVMTEANKFVEDPNATVVVKQINSRKVYISGNVFKPGAYSINDSMDIMQLIALAGGLQEYSDKENIRLLRRLPSGKTEAIPFNHNKIFESKNPDIPVLRPGDQVVVR